MISGLTAEQLARDMISGHFDHELVSAQLFAMSARGEREDEIIDFARAFREAALPVSTRHPVVMDLCGTGGAAARTFNVSTAASFIVASLGVPVAKHGNRSARLCGSADVMEALGARITLNPAEASKMLDEMNFTFLFAQTYHPAMRHVAPVRRSIGTRPFSTCSVRSSIRLRRENDSLSGCTARPCSTSCPGSPFAWRRGP